MLAGSRLETLRGLSIDIPYGQCGVMWLCQTPVCDSGDGWAALNFWLHDEVKHPNAVKINFVIFDLNDRSRRAEIPLLLDQGTQRVSLIR